VVPDIFFVHESHEPVILAKKAKKLRSETSRHYQTKFKRSDLSEVMQLKASLYRPLRLLATRPIIHVLSILVAYNFGVYCIALSTFAEVCEYKYHESVSSSGSNCLANALGSAVASQVGGPLTDRIFARLKSKTNGAVALEYRVPLMIPSAFLMPIGLI